MQERITPFRQWMDKMLPPDPEPDTTVKRKPYDVLGKMEDIYTNRRKFVSRGFVGSALIFLGATRTSRSITLGIIENRERIATLPSHIDEVPVYIMDGTKAAAQLARDIPENTERVMEKAGEVVLEVIETAPEVIKQAPEIMRSEAEWFSETGIYHFTCNVDGREEDRTHIHIPHIADRRISETTEEEYCEARLRQEEKSTLRRRGKKLVQKTDEDLRADTETNFKYAATGIGAILLGSKIIDKEGNDMLTRRKVVSRVVSGIWGGIFSVGFGNDIIPTDPIFDRLPK